jgi:hypothetical protein
VKQVDVLSPTNDYKLPNVQEYREEVESNGTHQLLFYADDVNTLSENRNTIKKTTQALTEANWGGGGGGLELNTKITNTVVSHHQHAGQNHDVPIAKKSFKHVAKFKHLGTRVTNHNCIQEEIKGRINWGNACSTLFRIFCLVSYVKT